MKKSRIKPMSAKKQSQMEEETRLKQVVYLMGKGMCELCGRRVIADRGHEIVFRSRGGSPLDPLNVIQLCSKCHNKEHNLSDDPPDSPEYLLGFIKAKRIKQGFQEE